MAVGPSRWLLTVAVSELRGGAAAAGDLCSRTGELGCCADESGASAQAVPPPNTTEQKATAAARKEMITFPLKGSTIPHETEGYFGAGHVWMKPAVGGTGLIAGGGVRAVLEAGGVKNILTKNLGSRNSFNTVYATLDALKQLRSREDVLKMRGDK